MYSYSLFKKPGPQARQKKEKRGGHPTLSRLCWRMKEILECTLIQGDRLTMIRFFGVPALKRIDAAEFLSQLRSGKGLREPLPKKAHPI